MLARRAALLCLAAPAALARAQGAWSPQRPVTIQIAFPAGGATDVQMRALAEAATRHLGQTVLIENRPGAGATLPAANMRNTRADGHTLAQIPLPAIRLPFMQRMGYDPRRDWTPVIHLTGYLFLTVVRADSPYQSLADLWADARRRPGEVRLGNTGANGTPHLTQIELAERENARVEHIPFRGDSDSVAALLGGHLEAGATGSGALQLIAEGRLRALAVWSRNRSPKLSDVPTLTEFGYANMVVTSPYGLVGPAGMEQPVVETLHRAFRAALHDPAHVAVLERLDMPLEYLGPADYAAFLARTADEEEARVARLGLRG